MVWAESPTNPLLKITDLARAAVLNGIVESISRLTVWRLLDRASLSVSGYDSVLCVAEAPLQLQDEDGFPGYVIRCRVVVLES